MLRRTLAIVGLSTLAVVGTALPAAAKDPWGSVECGQVPSPGCELGAGRSGQPAPSPDGGDAADEPGVGGSEPDGKDVRNPNPDLNRAKCSYHRSGYKPPAKQQATGYHELPRAGVPEVRPAVFQPEAPSVVAEPVAGPKPAEKGAWYVYRCEAGGVRDGYFRPPVWIPDGEPGGGPVSVAELARQARDQLRLPSPEIGASPAGEQLVKLPTWLWLERGSWQTGSATASVPGVSVTAVARPRWVKWSMGDGSSVRCTGRGTPYASKEAPDPKSPSPDCGYTYRSSSAGEPSDAYRVTATVHWSVTWSGAGQSGTFADLTTTSSASFRVAESQAVNTDD